MAKNKKITKNGNPAKRTENPAARALALSLIDYLEFSTCCDHHQGLLERATEEAMGYAYQLHERVGAPVRLIRVGLGSEELVTEVAISDNYTVAQVTTPISGISKIAAFLEDSVGTEDALYMVGAVLNACFEKLNTQFERSVA